MAMYCIHFKTKSGQISSDSVRIQGPSTRPNSGHLYPVSSVKESNRKCGKCKISRVLQSPLSSTQAPPKVEAGHRLKQAEHFSTHRKIQNGNSRVHQDLPDFRGMVIVDRPIRRLPSHLHPPKLKEIPKVLPQVIGVRIHLPPFQTSHSLPGLYIDCKGNEANGPLQGTETSPIPGLLADQVPVSGGSPTEHSGRSRPNPVLGVDNKSGKIQTKTNSGVPFVGYEYHLHSALVKPTQGRWLKLQDLILRLKSKHIFDCKIFVVANWVACLNR